MNGLGLCAGVGGLELGLRLCLGSGYRTVCWVERDAFAASILVARMEDASLDPAPIWDDLATFDGTPWRGVVDLISAGIPCQPFSSAGKRRGLADERWIWSHVARIIRDVEPGVVFLENVPGLARQGLRHIWADLRGMGYGVEAGLFSAAEVGAPHRRQRLFVLADRNGNGCWRQGVHLPGRGPWEAIPDASGAGEGVADSACEFRKRIWPPGPRWWTEHPNHCGCGLEPAIRGVADGPAYRVDRLRALGNGVVPLVAAHAFRTLAARL